MATRGGLGEPIASLSRERATLFLKILMSTMITYSLTITFVKISLLLLYRRIFSTPEFRRRSACVGCACVAWFVAEVLANIFQCRPFSSAFDPEKLYTSNCINLQAFYWGITIANLVLDVAVLSLPVHMVWTLKLSLRKRVELSVIFALGGV